MNTTRIVSSWAGILCGVLSTILAMRVRAEGDFFVALRFFAMFAGIHTAIFLALHLRTGRTLYLVVLRRVLPAIAVISAVAAVVLARIGGAS